MDLTTFRATYPGIFEQAFDAGAEAEADRQQRIRAVADSVGASPDRALAQGWTVAQAADHFRQFASRSDEAAAAFTRALRGALTTTTLADDDLDIDALVARLHGAPAAAPGASRPAAARAGQDIGDLFAESLPPPRAAALSSATSARTAWPSAAQPPVHSARDLQDLFASDLEPAPSRANGGAR